MFDALDMVPAGCRLQLAEWTRSPEIFCTQNTTRNERGEKIPYKRRFVVFAPGRADDTSKPGVHVAEVGLDQSPPLRKYEPGHPDADATGMSVIRTSIRPSNM